MRASLAHANRNIHHLETSDRRRLRRLKRGVFRSVVDLQAAISRFLAETNQMPKPFTWTASPDKIIAAVKCGHQVLDSIR
jgi:ribosomal protein S18 acetylase RimI-like enzyme